MAEAFVAKWFPKRHQLVIATLATYTGVFGLYKMAKGNPKPPKPSQMKKSAVVAAQPENINLPVVGGFHGPTLETFDAWSNNPDNLKKWEEWVAVPANVEKWEKSLA